MKRFGQCLSFLLAAAMLLSFPVRAAEAIEPRASDFFLSHSAYLREVDSFNFRIVFCVTATGTMEELGVEKIKVQISSDGENWATTQTYTRDTHPQFIKENALVHGYDFNYNGSRGYYYRAIMTLYAKNSTGQGVYTVYTPVIQLGT